MKKFRVIELFAGVGGFRVGLERISGKDFGFDFVWSSQWEPNSKIQHASEIYRKVFGEENHSNEDIQVVIDKNFNSIPDHDVLVGGFPCQDYSVARTSNQAAGLEGKKGVLWWSIYEILKRKDKKAPSILILENVDRLLKSPSSQRGRDFAVMISSLNNLGYAVEWRVINAAEYGMPQRRRRIYILGYKKNSDIYKKIKAEKDLYGWITKTGLFAKIFPINIFGERKEFNLDTKDLSVVSSDFNKEGKSSPFEDTGIMLDGKIITIKTKPVYKGKFITLGDIIEHDESKIDKSFFIDKKDLSRWEYLKGGKKEKRKSKSGYEYEYSEGSMIFPDLLTSPSRTIVTGEGGSSPSRFKHVIKTKSGKMRRLTPEELERLDMFDTGHTENMLNSKTPDIKRAFIAGNALVVGVIEKIGKGIKQLYD